MHILITGGAGFIGSLLAEALLRRGDSVTVLDNFDPYYDPAIKHHNLALAQEYEHFSLVEGDVRDNALVRDTFDVGEPQAVVHLAALAGVRESLARPLEFNDVNVGGTLVLLEAARLLCRPRVILASTSSVYGSSPFIPYREDDPLMHCISPYGASKIAAEKYGYIYHSVHGLDVVALRFFTAYGPRQRPDMAIHRFTRAILNGEELTLYGDGGTSRDYTYIDDVVAGVIAAIDGGGGAYNLINLGNSTATTLSELVAMIEKACGARAIIRCLPEQPGDPPHTRADIALARQALDFEPATAIEEGIGRFVEWYRGEVGY
jgi:UDP-glucuronate 4-epimerase